MKGKYMAIFAVFGFIIFFFSMEARAVDWVLCGKSRVGAYLFYYDSQSVKRVSKDILRVWTKTVYTEKGIQWWIKELGPKGKEVSYGICSAEINCNKKKYRSSLATLYNQDGGIIFSASVNFSSWDFVTPESGCELLFNIVCGGR